MSLQSARPTLLLCAMLLASTGCVTDQTQNIPAWGEQVAPAELTHASSCPKEVAEIPQQPAAARKAEASPPLAPAELGAVSDIKPLLTSNSEPAAEQSAALVPADTNRRMWGLIGLQLWATGQRPAPDGEVYKPLLNADLDVNLMLWRQEKVYFFLDNTFWGEKAEAGVTNVHQGAFDFSKRELDIDLGLAWNYYGRLEARIFGYSENNLNRGFSPAQPGGFTDGYGLENRYYLNDIYDGLGTDSFDLARAAFVSIGYFPTKVMVDSQGKVFKPGAFARAYLTFNVYKQICYLYTDLDFISSSNFSTNQFSYDGGVALRPFASLPRLEFRVGSEGTYDFKSPEAETGVYAGVQFIY